MRCEIVTYHGANKATFRCPAGHTFKRVVIPLKGRRRRAIGEGAILRMVSWWRSTGVNTDCPTCGKAKATGR